MNSFGLNRAAINGGVQNTILAGALFSVVGTATAIGTVTQFAGQIAFPISCQFQADGIRTAQGAVAPVNISLNVSASWALATTAAATFTVRSSGLASYTEAYMASALTVSAAGQIIRLGAAQSSTSFTAAAIPLLTAGGQAASSITSSLMADASVKRSGSNTTERDGYATLATSSSFTAAGVKVATGAAAADIIFSAVADGIKTHAGAAVMAGKFSVNAVGASDGAISKMSSGFTAKATLYAAGKAQFDSSFFAQAIGTINVPGRMASIEVSGTLSAEGRLAVRGAATFDASSGFTADFRLAALGQATSQSTSGMYAAPWIYRQANVTTSFSSDFAAGGTRTCFGAASITVKGRFIADAITNPAVLAPPGRTMRVPVEDRAMSVPYEPRTMTVTDESEMNLETYTKHPADKLDYDITYAEWLTPGDGVSEDKITVTIDKDQQLHAPIVTVANGVIKVWVAGGTNRVTYKVTVVVETDDGRIKQVEFTVKVKE